LRGREEQTHFPASQTEGSEALGVKNTLAKCSQVTKAAVPV
jgi:hypothetical protein